jgi:hypothetical protein
MELPHDKIVEDKELLTEKYNFWRDQLIERASSLAQAEVEKLRDPGRVVVIRQGEELKKVSIMDFAEAKKFDTREAKQYVQVLKAMLDALEKGELEEAWSDDALAAVPNLRWEIMCPRRNEQRTK